MLINKKTPLPVFVFALLIILFTLFTAVASAQTGYTKNDSAGIFELLKKAETLMEKAAYDSALQAANLALAVSRSKKMPRGEAHAHLTIADIGYRRSESINSDLHDSAALKIGIQLKDSFIIALSYYRFGQLFLGNNKNDKALALFNKALSVKFEKDQSAYTAVVYNDIGYLYGAQG